MPKTVVSHSELLVPMLVRHLLHIQGMNQILQRYSNLKKIKHSHMKQSSLTQCQLFHLSRYCPHFMEPTVIIIFTKAHQWTLFLLNPIHIFTLYCLHFTFLLAYPCLHLWSGFFPSQIKVCIPISLPCVSHMFCPTHSPSFGQQRNYTRCYSIS